MTSEREKALEQIYKYANKRGAPRWEYVSEELKTKWQAALSPSAQAPGGDVEEIARKLVAGFRYRIGHTDEHAIAEIAAALRSHAVDVTGPELRSEEALEDAAIQLEARAYDLKEMYEKPELAEELFQIAEEMRSRLAALTPRKPESSHDES